MGCSGSFYGTEANFQATIKPFQRLLPKSPRLTYKQYNWIDGLVAVTGPLDTTKPDEVCS